MTRTSYRRSGMIDLRRIVRGRHSPWHPTFAPVLRIRLTRLR
jgi:hypothetical protein